MLSEFVASVKWELDAYYFTSTKKDKEALVKHVMIQLSFLLNCMIGFLITFFLKFHIFLVSSNKTTIENLDKKGRSFRSIYDIGIVQNWY